MYNLYKYTMNEWLYEAEGKVKGMMIVIVFEWYLELHWYHSEKKKKKKKRRKKRGKGYKTKINA